MGPPPRLEPPQTKRCRLVCTPNHRAALRQGAPHVVAFAPKYHMGELSTPLRGGKSPADQRHEAVVYSLTLRHGVRLTPRLDMRSFLIAGLLVLIAFAAEAGPKKKGKPAAAPAPAAAPSSPAPDAAPAAAAADPGGGGGPTGVRGPTRIDFDDRLIQGQSNKSGAVYLYDRKELKVRSMIKKRDNFRDEIVGSLYDT